MKKIIFSLILALFVTLPLSLCTFAKSDDPCVTEVTVKPITIDNYIPRITFSKITASQATEDGLMVAFYIDGSLTQITPLNTSVNTTLYSVNINYKKTPDEIKIFSWDKENLKPLGASVDVLTSEVIETANTRVVNELLTPALDTTLHIRRNWINSTDLAAHSLLNNIDACVNNALAQKDDHLLTSEYSRRVNIDELLQIQEDANTLPESQFNKLKNFYDNGRDVYINNINSIMTFLNIKLFS